MGFFRTLFGIASTTAEVVDQGLSSVNNMLEDSSNYLHKQSQIMETLRNLKVMLARERSYLETMIRFLEIYHQQLDLLEKIPQSQWDQYSFVRQELLDRYNIPKFNDPKQLRLMFLELRISYKPNQFACPRSFNPALNAEVHEKYIELIQNREEDLQIYARDLQRYSSDLPWMKQVFIQTGGKYLIPSVFPKEYYEPSNQQYITRQ